MQNSSTPTKSTANMTSVFRTGALNSLEGRPSSSTNSGRPNAASINSLYKGGKLSAEDREKLKKLHQQEVAKDSLVAKFENKFGKKEKPAPPAASALVQAPVVEAPLPMPVIEAPAPSSPNSASGRASAAANSEWAQIVDLNKKAHLEGQKREKELANLAKLDLKRQLDEQVSQRMAAKEAEKIGRQQELQQVQQDVQKYLVEEKSKKDSYVSFLVKDKNIRSDQIKESIVRRQQERERTLREEERLVQRIQQELADEKARLQAKKEAHLAAMKVILEDNEKQRLIKLEQQRREQAEAVRLQEEYVRMLDKQERDRHSAMQKILEVQELSQQMYSTSVGANLAQQIKEDEERAAAMQAEFNRAREEKERQKAEQRKKIEAEVKQSLFTQMDERRRLAEKEKQESLAFAARIQADQQRAKQEEAERVAQAKAAAQKNKVALDAQLAEAKQKRTASESMSEAERKMNEKVLERLKAQLADGGKSIKKAAPF